MKKGRFFSLLFAVAVAISCGDTVVHYNQQVDDSVDAPATSGLFKKHVLIEDYTGTWCGYCARVAYAIERVFAEIDPFDNQADRAIAVAIHSGNDPYNFTNILPLKNLISPNSALGLPQSRLNRTVVWEENEADHIAQVKNLSSNNCGLGIAMTSAIVDNNINLDVNIKFAENYSNVKLVVYVLENHLIYDQRNYTNYFNGQNPIPAFEHNHVLRSSLTNLLGDPLSGTIYGAETKISYSVPVPANVSNKDNLSFVAFVVDENNLVINARLIEANETQSFEQNP
jgi:hypothetical protein